MNMNAMAFGDKYVVPGGKAMGFAASVRVRLASTGALKKEWRYHWQ
jgi:RecA/RadA recombinase